MQNDLFIAFGIEAPWPFHFPEGRIIVEKDRHLTLVFIGKTEKTLQNFPIPSFDIGLAGKFDKCLFLPTHQPRVVAWHADWLEKKEIETYRLALCHWLQKQEIILSDRKEFLSHVTLARSPFNIAHWQQHFSPLPFYLSGIHLFKSLGFSQYESLSHHTLIAPFEEIEHTADRAFLIRGKTLRTLYDHAMIALAFHYPSLLNYSIFEKCESLQEVIAALNQSIFLADKEIGAPYKAVSHHGHIKEQPKYLEWEMIVDV